MIRKALFYLLLATATVGLSRLFAAWRAWRAAPTPAGSALVALFGLVVLGAMLALGFLLYEVDRAAGRVRHRVRLYEWAIARRAAWLAAAECNGGGWRASSTPLTGSAGGDSATGSDRHG